VIDVPSNTHAINGVPCRVRAAAPGDDPSDERPRAHVVST
jgi:hypothetical protein